MATLVVESGNMGANLIKAHSLIPHREMIWNPAIRR